MQNENRDRLLSLLSAKGHVIWDWNGTLLNDVDHAIAVMNSLLADHSLPVLDRDRYQKIFEFPVRRYYDALGFDYAKETFENLCHRFVEAFMAGFHDLPLVHGTAHVLRTLAEKGSKQSILSATDQPSLDGMIQHYGLSGYLAHVYGIEDKFASSKVARGRELLDVSGVAADQTIIVGDTLHDLEVAHELGIEAVLVSHGHQCHEILSRAHKTVIAL